MSRTHRLDLDDQTLREWDAVVLAGLAVLGALLAVAHVRGVARGAAAVPVPIAERVSARQ